MVSLIAAVAENKVIGKDNDLVWHLPEDMRFFRETTKGHYVITGRRNYESIPEKYRPLKGRTNVVVTHDVSYKAPGAFVVNSLEEAIMVASNSGDEEVFLIGGGQIYKEALEKNLVDRMYLTLIQGVFEGDTFFPDFDEDRWEITSERFHSADDENSHGMVFRIYDKVGK